MKKTRKALSIVMMALLVAICIPKITVKAAEDVTSQPTVEAAEDLTYRTMVGQRQLNMELKMKRAELVSPTATYQIDAGMFQMMQVSTGENKWYFTGNLYTIDSVSEVGVMILTAAVEGGQDIIRGFGLVEYKHALYLMTAYFEPNPNVELNTTLDLFSIMPNVDDTQEIVDASLWTTNLDPNAQQAITGTFAGAKVLNAVYDPTTGQYLAYPVYLGILTNSITEAKSLMLSTQGENGEFMYSKSFVVGMDGTLQYLFGNMEKAEKEKISQEKAKSSKKSNNNQGSSTGNNPSNPSEPSEPSTPSLKPGGGESGDKEDSSNPDGGGSNGGVKPGPTPPANSSGGESTVTPPPANSSGGESAVAPSDTMNKGEKLNNEEKSDVMRRFFQVE